MSESSNGIETGVVYTETIVHAPPEQFVAEAPYQIAIVAHSDGRRLTARIRGARVGIGDSVRRIEVLDGVAFFERSI